MSYHQQLGIDIGGVARAASNVAQDPCLHRVTQQVLELRELEAAKAPVRPRAERGVGLCQAVKPLSLVIAIRKRPWLVPVVIGGMTAAIFGLGYGAGRASRRRSR